jgi:hypothetical protein
MNLKFAFAFILYWLLAGMFFYFGAVTLTGKVYYNPDNTNMTVTAYPGNATGAPYIAVTTGGGFDKLVQTFVFAFTGIGIAGAPGWAQALLGFIQSSISVMGLVLIFGGS